MYSHSITTITAPNSLSHSKMNDPTVGSNPVMNHNTTDAPVKTERYRGVYSWIIGITVFPWICPCPIDERQVPTRRQVAPVQDVDGKKIFEE